MFSTFYVTLPGIRKYVCILSDIGVWITFLIEYCSIADDEIELQKLLEMCNVSSMFGTLVSEC